MLQVVFRSTGRCRRRRRIRGESAATSPGCRDSDLCQQLIYLKTRTTCDPVQAASLGPPRPFAVTGGRVLCKSMCTAGERAAQRWSCHPGVCLTQPRGWSLPPGRDPEGQAPPALGTAVSTQTSGFVTTREERGRPHWRSHFLSRIGPILCCGRSK